MIPQDSRRVELCKDVPHDLCAPRSLQPRHPEAADCMAAHAQGHAPGVGAPGDGASPRPLGCAPGSVQPVRDRPRHACHAPCRGRPGEPTLFSLVITRLQALAAILCFSTDLALPCMPAHRYAWHWLGTDKQHPCRVKQPCPGIPATDRAYVAYPGKC